MTTKKKFNAGKILRELGACDERANKYSGMTLKQAWNSINNLDDFMWIINQLSASLEPTSEYYDRALYAVIAAIVEETALKNGELKEADVKYIDSLNYTAATGKGKFRNLGTFGHCSADCFGCWCVVDACEEIDAISEAIKNVKRVVRTPTEKEILSLLDDAY